MKSGLQVMGGDDDDFPDLLGCLQDNRELSCWLWV